MLHLVPLPAFVDNYIWVLHNNEAAVVVDPGDASPVLDFLSRHRLSLAGILVTHHHQDHIGGLQRLAPHCCGVIVAPDSERQRIAHATQFVKEGDRVGMLGWVWDVMEVPGHTAGHVAYWTHPPQSPPVLMSGDTLFSAGCGRLFEGTAEEMHNSLSRLANLPDNTLVCCAHEYTLSNLRFAAAIEPHNPDIRAYQKQCLERRERNLPTLPSSIGLEKTCNPFLRTHEPHVVQATSDFSKRTTSPGHDTLRVLREWKNQY